MTRLPPDAARRLRRLPHLRTLETLLYVALFAWIGHRYWPQVAAALGVGSRDDPAPSFTATTLDGEPVSLEDLRGRVVLVNFWATWCLPCRVEMPGFERVYREKRERGFVIVALSADRTGTSTVERFLSERGITFPVAMASEEVERGFGGVRGLPTSFLIDREGRVRHRVYGIFAEPALRLAVDRLLQEGATAAPAAGSAPRSGGRPGP